MPEKIEVEKHGTIVDAVLPDRNIYMRAERIRESSNLVKAEVSISVEQGGVKTLLNRGRISMLEDAPKIRLIDLLIEKGNAIGYSDPEDIGFWGNVIDEGFYAIVDKFRQGNEATEMTNLSDASPRIFDIDPIITKGVANLIWAPGGSYKSYFGLLTCVMIDRGLEILGMKARKGKALFLDWEEEEAVFKSRLYSIQKSIPEITNPETSGIIRKEMGSESLGDSLEELSKIIHEHNISYVLIDSVNPALSGAATDAHAIEDYNSALRDMQVTSLSLDHANRSGEKSGNWSIHGSAFKYNRSRQVYEVKKARVPNSTISEFGLYHRKSNDSALASPRIFEVEFTMRPEKNPEDRYYSEVLDKVTFRSKKLKDASGEFMQAMEVPEIAYELMKEVKECDLPSLAANVSSIKGTTISPANLEIMLNGSSGLAISHEWVTLASQSTVHESTVSVKERTLDPCKRCDENDWEEDDSGTFCRNCGQGSD